MDELEEDHKRSRIRRVLVPLLVALVLLAAGISLLRPANDDGGGTAPDFELPYLDGSGTLSSEELKGKPVVINLWASWCIPCREEAPALEEMWRKYKDRVAIVGINVRDTEEAAREFAREFSLTYPLVRDTDRTVEKALGAFGLPETFFIDHTWTFAGVARGDGSEPKESDSRGSSVYLGGITAEELEANIIALLEMEELE